MRQYKGSSLQQCCCCLSIIFVVSLMCCPRGGYCHLPETKDVLCSANDKSGHCQFGSKGCKTSSCGNNLPVIPLQNSDESEDNCKQLYTYQQYPASRVSNRIDIQKVPYSVNPNYFQLLLDWDSWNDAQGYYISINVITYDGEENPPPKLYSYRCIKAQPADDRMNLTLFMEYRLSRSYANCKSPTRFFEVIIVGLPVDPFIGETPSYHTFEWPMNCFNIIKDETVCGFHSPGSVVISAETFLLPNSTSSMSAVVTWDNPSNTIATITDYEVSLLNPSKFFNVYVYNVNATTNIRSLTISPLNIFDIYHFAVLPFQDNVCQYECIHGNSGQSHVTCGTETQISFSYVPPPSPSPSPSIDPSQLTSSPIPAAAVLSSTMQYSPLQTPFSFTSFIPSTTTTSHALSASTIVSKYYGVLIGVGVMVVIIVVLVVILITAIVRVIHGRRHPPSPIDLAEEIHALKGNSSDSSSSGPSTATSTRSPTPISPSPLLLQSPASPSTLFSYDHIVYDEPPVAYYHEQATLPDYYQEPHPDSIPPGVKLILVVESLHNSEEDFKRKVHLSFLGCELGRCRGVRVLHYNPCSRKPPSRWLMEYMSKADTVICICTPEFMDEWRQSREESLVHPLRDYIVGSGSTGKSLSDKYLTLTHSKEDMKYIPEELNSVRHCLIEETDKVYRIITQTSEEIIV